MYIYIYIYLYMERERDRQREKDHYIYKYIYIVICCNSWLVAGYAFWSWSPYPNKYCSDAKKQVDLTYPPIQLQCTWVHSGCMYMSAFDWVRFAGNLAAASRGCSWLPAWLPVAAPVPLMAARGCSRLPTACRACRQDCDWWICQPPGRLKNIFFYDTGCPNESFTYV